MNLRTATAGTTTVKLDRIIKLADRCRLGLLLFLAFWRRRLAHVAPLGLNGQHGAGDGGDQRHNAVDGRRQLLGLGADDLGDEWRD